MAHYVLFSVSRLAMLFSSIFVRVGVVLAISLPGLAAAQETGPAAPSVATIVQEMEHAQAQNHAAGAYQVIRDYQLAAASSSTSDSDVVVAVQFNPPSSKDYAIQKTSGSSRGLKIVRKILDHEVEQAKQQSGAAALTSDNYDFAYLGEGMIDDRPCYRLALKPKRKATDLVVGEALVDKSSFLVRHIEGELAKTPSWWLKDVHLKISFADMEGTWLQTGAEAIANVRFMGAQKLTSRTIDYRGSDVVAANVPRHERARVHEPVRAAR